MTRPMVMLINGLGVTWESFDALRQSLSTDTRVCAYHRPGIGTSDAPRTGVTAQTNVVLLEEVIDAVRDPAQVDQMVLIAHSLGGSIAVPYARAHADQVKGLVLFDCTPPGYAPALLEIIPEYEPPISKAFFMRKNFADLAATGLAPEMWKFVDVEGADAGSLGAIPLVTIAHGDAYFMDELGPPYAEPLQAAWTEGETRWAALSSDSEQLVAAGAKHFVHTDDPELALEKARSVIVRAQQ